MLGALVLTILLGAGFASGSVALAKGADTKLIEGGDTEHLIGKG